mmetsp:Transcript_80319/g.228716  ORF Transcript_80319/g.228716 Transcript_80319/m.228716 type:complete len:229 (+) Transcript_80319:964-1650(+)
MMSVHTASRNPVSCETISTVAWVRLTTVSISHWTLFTSRWLVGSSRRMISGLASTARASASIMRQPPESSAHTPLSLPSSKPISRSICSIFSAPAFASRGSSWVYTSTFLESSISSSKCDSTNTRTSSSGKPSILPLAMLRSRVVLPAPLWASTPYVLPRWSQSLVLCSRTLPPYASEKSMLHTSSPRSSNGLAPMAIARHSSTRASVIRRNSPAATLASSSGMKAVK